MMTTLLKLKQTMKRGGKNQRRFQEHSLEGKTMIYYHVSGKLRRPFLIFLIFLLGKIGLLMQYINQQIWIVSLRYKLTFFKKVKKSVCMCMCLCVIFFFSMNRVATRFLPQENCLDSGVMEKIKAHTSAASSTENDDVLERLRQEVQSLR